MEAGRRAGRASGDGVASDLGVKSYAVTVKCESGGVPSRTRPVSRLAVTEHRDPGSGGAREERVAVGSSDCPGDASREMESCLVVDATRHDSIFQIIIVTLG